MPPCACAFFHSTPLHPVSYIAIATSPSPIRPPPSFGHPLSHPPAVTPAAVIQATNYYDIPDSDDPACHGAYMEAADVANSALDVELEWMFDRVKWALTLLLRGNVEFPGYLAYPGFHIFLGDERFDGIEVR